MHTTEPALGPRILIVDDDEDARWVLGRFLEDNGFVVVHANNGKSALELLIAEPEPALVILDLEMPVMSGLELLQIMDGYERLSRVPVLVLSSRVVDIPGSDQVIGFVSKPCELDELLSRVNECIERVRPACAPAS